MSNIKFIDYLEKAMNEHPLLLNNQDWKNTSFSIQKAYIASIFSLAAYEIKSEDRASVVPCHTYNELYITGSFIDLELEFEKYFSALNKEHLWYKLKVIKTKIIIAVIVKYKDVIFISLRGTQTEAGYKNLLIDISVDLHISKKEFEYDKNITFHHGFYDAVKSCYVEVINYVKTITNKDIPIYITGHSLGGGMAAIFNALWNKEIELTEKHSQYYFDITEFKPTACYTFGMPRYGNQDAVDKLFTPYHIYNEEDPVAKVPPKCFGFSDIPENKELRIIKDGGRILECIPGNHDTPVVKRFFNKILNRIKKNKIEKEEKIIDLSAHSIETYINNIGVMVNYNPQTSTYVTVPNFVGMLLDKAKEAIHDFDNFTADLSAVKVPGKKRKNVLCIGKTVPKQSSEITGTVINQNPSYNQKVKIGSPIDLEYSSDS